MKLSPAQRAHLEAIRDSKITFDDRYRHADGTRVTSVTFAKLSDMGLTKTQRRIKGVTQIVLSKAGERALAVGK